MNRALAALARREYSLAELKRKLSRFAQSENELDQTLEVLQSRGYLSEARFAENLVRKEAARKGTAWIKQSLRQHDLPAEVIAEATGDLQASEEARARALWERRFGVIADDPKERLRQMRFLAARGFSHELIRRITRSS
ncbi:MAG: recombination regulator RecX [Betaproteobacteria bacterium]|nr:recombination regulator RecX [Betaproteobacteria bacterium]NBO44662.1 recombination regulator RecX [Betaproteobacteria bacterium]NBP10983.1 recombination regulator RecX [Betaproteobacteria bacterium]NBQ08924.1 recombination regulator RecX [Betaproteobacteria bacterium]NCU98973.1 recombination regulator RecX [Betaproteobacteria bacterium]